ncbi:hypothetical protein P7K49_029427 [Saguinus oedipus]|uniref:Uncharacterized protein n=1 Tax=Saguinus oedipus TaxID=9490 RepID=A0ABQ9U759_SAGOE|nr:hypothetical protein P7K49_029427 [Saguinus oedipus]
MELERIAAGRCRGLDDPPPAPSRPGRHSRGEMQCHSRVKSAVLALETRKTRGPVRLLPRGPPDPPRPFLSLPSRRGGLGGRGLTRRDALRPRCAAGLNAVPGETGAGAVRYGAEGRQTTGAGFRSGASQKQLRTRRQLPRGGEAAAPRSAGGLLLLLLGGSPSAPRSCPGDAERL